MEKYAIGIDFGGTKILTALVDTQTGKVIDSVKKKTKKDKNPLVLMEKLTCSIDELLETVEIGSNDVGSIGIGIAGQVNRESGVLLCAPNLDCYNVDIKNILYKKYGKQIYVGNDVEVATFGEMSFGAAKDCDDFICIFVGTGIGSSIVKGSQIILGSTGTAGEIGHMVVDANGRACECGACGCLEAYASRTAIEKRLLGYIKRGQKSCIVDYIEEGKSITSSMIRKSLKNNDSLTKQVIDEASEYLGSAIASIINLLNPKLIILGGGLIQGVDKFYQLTVDWAKTKALKIAVEDVVFKKAMLEDFSGVIGAAKLSQIRNS